MGANELTECVNLTEIMDIKQEIRNIIWRQNIISLRTVCEVRLSRIKFFTVNFVFENLMYTKVKHFFFTVSTPMALRLCDTFGMLKCIHKS